MTHDPMHCVKQLRQTLAADKLAIGFFVGAGCPCAIRVPGGANGDDQPLIPDIAGLTQVVVKELSASKKHRTAFKSLTEVLREDGQQPNIERVLSRIRALRAAAGSGEIRGLRANDLDELDREVCSVIKKAVDRHLPSDATPYHSLARVVGSHPVPAPEIFTTNYDLLAEQALESLRVPFFDGFVGSVTPFFDQQAIEDDPLPPRWSFIWKLHGSINWRLSGESRPIRGNDRNGEDLLIHPSHRKYEESRRMPYLVMIDRLKAFLRNGKQPVAIFAIGHSFSDEHLNATITEGLRANPSAACFALQYDELARYRDARKLAETESGFWLLARDAAIIRRREGKWLAKPREDATALSAAFEVIDQNGAATAPDDSDEPRGCRFLLGDFLRFGRFLDEFAGYHA